jgi:ubiquitin carboxyl-terminal hydrolase 10
VGSFQGGHQEDAEEFLGFYLDTLEEELLSMASAFSPSGKAVSSKAVGSVEVREEEEPPQEDGWMEVGRRNRMVVTRTVGIFIYRILLRCSDLVLG